jgi:hypothetical protein
MPSALSTVVRLKRPATVRCTRSANDSVSEAYTLHVFVRTVEIHPGVVGLAIHRAAGDTAVAEGVHAGDATVRIQVAELGRLREGRPAAVERDAGGELVAAARHRVEAGELTRGAGVVLRGVRPVQRPLQFSAGSSLSLHVDQAAARGKRCLAGVSPGR